MTETTPKQNDSDEHRNSFFTLPSPAKILNVIASKAPLLIGWDDDALRKIVEDHKKEHADDESRNIDEVGFGLQGIISDAMKEYIYKRSNFDDLKSDLKKYEDRSKKVSDDDDADDDADVSHKNEGSFNIREMKLYQNLLTSVTYQRDAYIMGLNHADSQKQHRADVAIEKQNPSKDSSLAFPFGTIKNTLQFTTYQQYLDKNPLIPQEITPASTQLTNLAAWFLPSPVMHNALLPTVLWTIAPAFTPPHNLPQSGPLRKQVIRSSSDLIPLSQSLLDRTMKNSIIWVLEDSKWRDHIKGTTRGMVGKMQRDEDENLTGSGRFVTTKTVYYNSK